MKSLIDSKLEKFKNLWEESHFYWGEIGAGTLKFDRVESEVSVLLSATMPVKEIVSSIKQTGCSLSSKTHNTVIVENYHEIYNCHYLIFRGNRNKKIVPIIVKMYDLR